MATHHDRPTRQRVWHALLRGLGLIGAEGAQGQHRSWLNRMMEVGADTTWPEALGGLVLKVVPLVASISIVAHRERAGWLRAAAVFVAFVLIVSVGQSLLRLWRRWA